MANGNAASVGSIGAPAAGPAGTPGGATDFGLSGFTPDVGVDSFGNALGGNQGAGSIGVPSAAGLAGFFGALTGIPLAGQAFQGLVGLAGDTSFGPASPGFGPGGGPGGEIPEEVRAAIARANAANAARQATLSPEFANLTASPGFSTAVSPNLTQFTAGGQNLLEPINAGAFGGGAAFGGGGFDINSPAGGFNITPSGLTFTPGGALTGSFANRRQQVGQAASFLESQASQLDLGPISTGIERKSAADLARFDAESQSLRSTQLDSFARRKLAGSSFVSDALARSATERSLARSVISATSALQVAQVKDRELTQKIQLRGQADALRIQQAQAEITDLFGISQEATELGAAFAELFEGNARARLAADIQERDSIRRTLGALETARIDAETRLEGTRISTEGQIRQQQIAAASGERIAGERLEGEGIAGFGGLFGDILGAGEGSVASNILKTIGFG
tara:strand:+ start:3223 stop:4587 length:1365 start_codon:yes stop_codon:yes gene_type:complete